jgi:GntR family transcriptional regulator
MGLAIHLDKQSGIPLYVQIEQQIRLLVHQGILKAGDLMPTVRALAVDLGINLNTVARVYRDLEQAGVLVLKRGIGTFVAESLPRSPVSPKEREALEKRVAELIQFGRRLRLTSVELLQLVETRWKESSDAQR